MSSSLRDILGKLNQQNTIDSMRCISTVKTAEDLKAAADEGYMFGMTASDWDALGSGLPADKVFCPKAVLYPPNLIYYDEEKYLYRQIPIMCGQFIMGTKEETFSRLKKTIAVGEQSYLNKDYKQILYPLLSEQSGNISMKIARDMLDNEPPSDKLYDIVLNVYTFGDCGSSFLCGEGFQKWLACKTEKQKHESEKSLDMLPFDKDGNITVYRGEGSLSTPHDEACSWTLDIARACAFATGVDGSIVYKGTVNRNSVVEYVADRNEKELIVIPGSVKNVTPVQFYNYSEFTDVVAASRFDNKHRFPERTKVNAIIEDSTHAFRDVNVQDHTRDHVVRVALLASFLYRIGPLLRLAGSSKKEFDKAASIYEKLIFAAEYHDAGRTSNDANTTHGANGYAAYKSDYGEDDIIDFLCTFHCRNDEEAKAFWEKTFATHPMKHYIWEAFITLRDADALDRVRFGSGCADYLDGRTLRLKDAVRLIPVAIDISNRKI